MFRRNSIRSGLVFVFPLLVCLGLLVGCPRTGGDGDGNGGNTGGSGGGGGGSQPTATPGAGGGGTPTGETVTLDLGGGVSMVLVKVSGGSFDMGTESTDISWLSHSRPVHRVSVPTFYMGK